MCHSGARDRRAGYKAARKVIDRDKIEREMDYLRGLLKQCHKGSPWERPILDRISCLREKLKEMGDNQG